MPRRILIRPQGRILVAFLMAWNASCWSSWQVVQPAGAGFAVELPGPIECRPGRILTEWGTLEEERCWSSETALERWFPMSFRHTSIFVSWSELPQSLDEADWPELYEAIRKQMLNDTSPGFVQSIERDGAVTMGGKSGMEFEVVSTLPSAPSDRASWRVRMCVHEGKFFRLSAIGNPARFEARGWERVIESFRFVER